MTTATCLLIAGVSSLVGSVIGYQCHAVLLSQVHRIPRPHPIPGLLATASHTLMLRWFQRVQGLNFRVIGLGNCNG